MNGNCHYHECDRRMDGEPARHRHTIICPVFNGLIKIMEPIGRSRHKKHVYEISITYHLKDMANVKVFKRWVKLQGQGYEVKNYGTNRKFLS
jgi:hypothetical protein